MTKSCLSLHLKTMRRSLSPHPLLHLPAQLTAVLQKATHGISCHPPTSLPFLTDSAYPHLDTHRAQYKLMILYNSHDNYLFRLLFSHHFVLSLKAQIQCYSLMSPPCSVKWLSHKGPCRMSLSCCCRAFLYALEITLTAAVKNSQKVDCNSLEGWGIWGTKEDTYILF